MRLQGKNAVVTGGGSGIGKAIARAFAAEGANVAIFDTNAQKAEAVSAEISAKHKVKACAIRCDVGDCPQVEAAFKEVDRHLGRLDILVNNAGTITQSPIVEMSEADWDKVLRVNLKGVFLCSQQAGRRMIKQGGGGRIIAISSVHAVISEPNCGHYTASKGGLESFCRTLATELARHKITVNYIRPGATYTELTEPMYTPAVVKVLHERIPLKEIAQPEWIAAGAVFLASDESRYMTGQHLTIDGGYLMDGSLPGAEYWK